MCRAGEGYCLRYAGWCSGAGPWAAVSWARFTQRPFPPLPAPSEGATATTDKAAAPYKELEAITCDLSAFPACQFFRVEVRALARGYLRDSPGVPTASFGEGAKSSQASAGAEAGACRAARPLTRPASPAPQCIIRPWRLDKVVAALNANGIRGMTVCDVRGAGVQGGRRERYAGTEFGTKQHYLVEKSKIDIVVARGEQRSLGP